MNIKKIRTGWGLTQAQLGRLMGMNQRHISRLETGNRALTIQQTNHLFVLTFLVKNGLLDKLILEMEENQ